MLNTICLGGLRLGSLSKLEVTNMSPKPSEDLTERSNRLNVLGICLIPEHRFGKRQAQALHPAF